MPCNLALAVVTILSAAFAYGETPEEKGYRIAAASDHNDKGFESSSAKLTMILRNAAGAEARRTLNIQTLEKIDDTVGDKSIVLFTSPPDVDGTALLSHAKILEPDDQWLYLPALRRVKRISSRNKSGPFMGSEFAFEDFTGQELNKFTYKYLKVEPHGEFLCDVIERVPRYEYSSYTRQIIWIDQKLLVARKVEFFDRRNEHLKTVIFENYQQYNGLYWRPHIARMSNHQTEKSTVLEYEDYQFKIGLTERDFTRAVLETLR